MGENERECPFVPQNNPVECPNCGSTEVNVTGQDYVTDPKGRILTVIHCDECGYHGLANPPETNSPIDSDWDPIGFMREIGLLPSEENDR